MKTEENPAPMFAVVAAMLLLVLAADVGAIAFHWSAADTMMHRTPEHAQTSPVAAR